MAEVWIVDASRAKEAAFVAANAALIVGVLTGALLIACTRASAGVAIGSGFGVWVVGGLLLGMIMPRNWPDRS
ncbi:hypothetical protein [Streptomyces sp. NPDC091268]|uniref:hypothetical protein n=1 Tax=Streptomyces sp. NPDC091268 TaxID=3365979 RepID=UPI00381BC919